MQISTFRIVVVGDDGRWFSVAPSSFTGDDRRIQSVGVFVPSRKGEKFDHEITPSEKDAVVKAIRDLLKSV